MGIIRKESSQLSRDQLITLIGGKPTIVARRRRGAMDLLASAASEGVIFQAYRALEVCGEYSGQHQETLTRFRTAALNQVANSGSLVTPQQSWTLGLARGVVSVVDLHGSLFNRPALQALIDNILLHQSGSQARDLAPGHSSALARSIYSFMLPCTLSVITDSRDA